MAEHVFFRSTAFRDIEHDCGPVEEYKASIGIKGDDENIRLKSYLYNKSDAYIKYFVANICPRCGRAQRGEDDNLCNRCLSRELAQTARAGLLPDM
jgi:hypothetical protein